MKRATSIDVYGLKVDFNSTNKAGYSINEIKLVNETVGLIVLIKNEKKSYVREQGCHCDRL